MLSRSGPIRLQDGWRTKIEFMDNHGIDVAIVSITDLDMFSLTPKEAVQRARIINDELQRSCEAQDQQSIGQQEANGVQGFQPQTRRRLYAFGVLPLVEDVGRQELANAVKQVQGLDRLAGVLLTTSGFGRGLDDDRLEDVYQELADAGIVAFVHPQSPSWQKTAKNSAIDGISSACFDLPFELTKSLARLILSGVLDRHPDLKLLVSYSAGALPFLLPRLSNIVEQNSELNDKLKNDVRFYLGQMWFDAVTCGSEELSLLERTVARAEHFEGKEEELEFVDRVTRRSDLLADTGDCPGTDRILFGNCTDHAWSFETGARLKAVDDCLEAIQTVDGWSAQEREKVLGLNAVELFNIDV
ncbi:hypothetical protein OIV83_003377 [Microbotryomycetes sp. JL201]|nr:hypothetical protein OIV83_003377 [Microbotryomycetes sp. JL201]